MSKIVRLSSEEVEALKKAIAVGTLDTESKDRLLLLIESFGWLLGALRNQRIGLSKLRGLIFGPKTEKSKNLTSPDNASCEEDDLVPDADSSHSAQPTTEEALALLKAALGITVEAPAERVSDISQPRGHGRRGSDAYPFAEEEFIPHGTLKAGERCPNRCGGKLYMLEPRIFMTFEGHSPVTVKKLSLARLRCSLCGQLYCADAPVGTRKYSYQLRALLAVNKYFGGVPFYRLEKMQQMLGVPLAGSTIWDEVEDLANAVYPVYNTLYALASCGTQMGYDDTGVKILSHKLLKKTGAPVKGTHTTGIVSYTSDHHVIALYLSGMGHAGENMTELLKQRPSDLNAVILMSDALSCNSVCEFIDKIIKALCLSHGRRKFFECYDHFPEQCRIVLTALGVVYWFDAYTKKAGMTDFARLLYHQERSSPVMEALHTWFCKQLEEHLVEPNSALGKAIRYMIKHWEGLTCFLRIPGVPLDNTFVERSLKIPIRVRKNAPMHKTEHGAAVAGLMLSLIDTCRHANQNPVHYLASLDEYRSHVKKHPEQWVPWTYQETLQRLKTTSPLKQAA